jgi:ATP-dependent exoDNAse (exonuclease V) alpha subunit
MLYLLNIIIKYMITRNYDTKRGLVNGVEVVLVKMRAGSIVVRMHSGEEAVLPRLNFVIDPEESGLPFVLHRRQFPLIPSYALTVHRVQGQTLRFLGIYFSGDAFCHGMLFTALSRVRSWSHVRVFDQGHSDHAEIPPSADVCLKNCVRRHIVAHLCV